MALLQNKSALITGGSRGIGRGIVERFLEEGADVAFTYVSSPEKANALAGELAAKYGERFEPPASLVEKAERGEVYSDEQALVEA